MSEPTDWLDDDANKAAQAKREQDGLEISRLYSLFDRDPTAKRLLALWDTGCLHKRTPVNASHAQYAADEAIRAFVAGIHHQMEIARKAEG
jgi:hypothetical protein